MGKGLRQPVELFQQLDRMPELDGEYAGQQKDSWRQAVQARPHRRGALCQASDFITYANACYHN